MTQPYVKSTIESEVAYIEFFHPDHNSLPEILLVELIEAIIDAGNNDRIKVIVLRSGGERTFCAGASFKELININDEASGKLFFSGFANLINTMRKCPKFIIGRVQGKTVGGGLGLVASTDYCMASKFASIKLSELNIGIGPFVVGPAIERKIGLSALSQIAIDTDTFYSAEWAKQKGLYTFVYESTEELDKAVKETAEHLSTFSIESMREMKKTFWEGTENWDILLAERAKTSGKLVLSDFTKKKLNSFK